MTIIERIIYSNVLNLIIVIGLLSWLIGKYKLFAFISKKTEEIAANIQNLKKDREFRQTQLNETKDRVKNLDQEVFRMVSDGEVIAKSLAERILEDAENEAANMQKKAQLTVISERKMATNEVVQEVTTSAFALAEANISTAIDERLHKKYIDNFIDNLGNLHE